MKSILNGILVALSLLASSRAHATDSTDWLVLENSIASSAFQDRCRLRFVNAAISVTSENVVASTNAVTATGSPVLHFASAPGSVAVGWTAVDTFNPAAIPAGTIVETVVTGTVTLNANVATAAGIGSGDQIIFSPPSHAARNAFAGALFAGNVDLKLLTMAIVANATVRTSILANPNTQGGNALDSDIDFQVNSIFTGMATARSW